MLDVTGTLAADTMDTMETSIMASMFNYPFQKYGVLMILVVVGTLAQPACHSSLALNHRNLLNTDIFSQGTWLKRA
ncbi:hypothetical protein BGAL_0441g00100 [Botrytis galanthina]|uniref:Uncharacterized protein n=1 Tax=Botrytis galanthina TaxID=278940 RepID=A0A4V4HTK7_9HELO|nr:hypothetical protein BGAL_0441g00100 [Botrytis galanthina]